MSMDMRVVVLAAGKGTRMRSEIPKVFIPLNGRPMIQHLLDSIKKSGADSRPVLVVGENKEQARRALGDGYDYVYQAEQLGTGHAVQCAERLLKGNARHVMVLYGDHPLVGAATIAKLAALHKRQERLLSMMTTTVEDFDGWRAPFADFGRVIRDASGSIAGVVEAKDATPRQREITELNPAFFAFRAEWLWDNLKKISNENAAQEYYLGDLVRIAAAEGAPIASLAIDPREAIGVNTPEHLAAAQSIVQ